MNVADNRLLQPVQQQLQAMQGSEWWPLLARWRDSAAGQALMASVDTRVAAGHRVYPRQVFRALALTSQSRVRVVILGQDPYHGPGQAEGLAFSVPDGVRCPPSLRNIFKELQRDLYLPLAAVHTSLGPWARQGVLLLNTSLTVEDGHAGSHSSLGWQVLTDAIVQALLESERGLVFMLWGAHAQARLPVEAAAAAPRHLVLRSNHPSPLSALRAPVPFIGCGHFGQADRWLRARGVAAVHWQLAPSAARAIVTGSPEGCPSG